MSEYFQLVNLTILVLYLIQVWIHIYFSISNSNFSAVFKSICHLSLHILNLFNNTPQFNSKLVVQCRLLHSARFKLGILLLRFCLDLLCKQPAQLFVFLLFSSGSGCSQLRRGWYRVSWCHWGSSCRRRE